MTPLCCASDQRSRLSIRSHRCQHASHPEAKRFEEEKMGVGGSRRTCIAKPLTEPCRSDPLYPSSASRRNLLAVLGTSWAASQNTNQLQGGRTSPNSPMTIRPAKSASVSTSASHTTSKNTLWVTAILLTSALSATQTRNIMKQIGARCFA